MLRNNMIIVMVLGALLALGAVIVIMLYLRIRRTENECALLMTGNAGKNFVEIVNDNVDCVEALTAEVDELSDRYGAVLRRMAGAMQHVGVVRFDAFRDLGGLLSFAVAMLDDRGNGIVISSIYGRSDSRTYTKPIVERNSSHELSPEEREAIKLAMQSRELGALPVEARDREHYEKIATLKLFHEKDFEQVPEPEPLLQPQPKPEPRRPERPQVQPRRQATRPAPEPKAARPRPSTSGGQAPPPRSKRRDDRPETVPPKDRTQKRARTRVERPMEPEAEERIRGETPPEAPTEKRSAGSGRGLDSPVERLRRREPEE